MALVVITRDEYQTKLSLKQREVILSMGNKDQSISTEIMETVKFGVNENAKLKDRLGKLLSLGVITQDEHETKLNSEFQKGEV